MLNIFKDKLILYCSKIKDFAGKNKRKIAYCSAIIAILVIAFWYGGDSKSLHGWNVSNTQNNVTDENDNGRSDKKIAKAESGKDNDTDSNSDEQETIENTTDNSTEQEAITDTQLIENDELKDNQNYDQGSTDKTKSANDLLGKNKADKKNSNTVTDNATPTTDKAEEIESNISNDNNIDNNTVSNVVSDTDNEQKQNPSNTTATDKENNQTTNLYCYITISCATILDNMDMLDEAKKGIVPDDGIIMNKTKVRYNNGETVFDVLKKIIKEKNIHMEYSYSSVFKSAYIEGISNLYEFDCGELSGWMYSVNGTFPNYGCSQYKLNNDDNIVWEYTCELGNDIGGGF